MTQNRTYNWILDVRARLAGACNESTWSEERSTFAPGYAHWRCARRRGHYPVTPHRQNNYVWATGGRSEYDPLPVEGLAPHWNLIRRETPFWKVAKGRKMVASLRRERAIDRKVAESMAARRAERAANGLR
jgi:hypothetical protein